MKRFALIAAVATLFAGTMGTHLILGQGGRNPFVGRSDTGEIVHVLPPPASIRSPRDTQPSDAPARNGLQVYAASYGSGNLIDHGGHEIGGALGAGFFAIYWNATVANSPGSQGYSTLRSTIQNFAMSYSDGAPYSRTDPSADYSILQQYGSTDAISPTLTFVGDFADNQAKRSSISDSQIRSYLANLFAIGQLTPDEHTVFGVYFPSGMKVSMQPGSNSCTSFCGYHGNFVYNGSDIKYAVFPYSDCRGCSLSGKAVADMLTIVSSHEIRESVSDPDLNAWYDKSGYEADDKCAWHNLYQTTRGHFWVQPEYSNGGNTLYPGPGCVVPNK